MYRIAHRNSDGEAQIVEPHLQKHLSNDLFDQARSAGLCFKE